MIARLLLMLHIQCRACRDRGAPVGMFICAGHAPWHCVNAH